MIDDDLPIDETVTYYVIYFNDDGDGPNFFKADSNLNLRRA